MRELIGLQGEYEAGVKAWEDEHAHFDSGRSPVERAAHEDFSQSAPKVMGWKHRTDRARQDSPKYASNPQWNHVYWSHCGDYVVRKSEAEEWVVRYRGVPLLGFRRRDDALIGAREHRDWLERNGLVARTVTPTARLPRRP
jgi:hypothetical protein